MWLPLACRYYQGVLSHNTLWELLTNPRHCWTPSNPQHLIMPSPVPSRPTPMNPGLNTDMGFIKHHSIYYTPTLVPDIIIISHNLIYIQHWSCASIFVHTTLLTPFACPLPPTLGYAILLVYKPLFSVCIRNLKSQLVYPSTQHLIWPSQLLNSNTDSWRPNLQLHYHSMLLSVKASLRLNPKSLRFSSTWNIWTELVGRHCIATLWLWVGIWTLSSAHTSYPAYMCGPSCLPLATHHPGSPQDTCGLSGPPHMAYCLAGLLVRTPCSLSDWLFCQDSVHGGAP